MASGTLDRIWGGVRLFTNVAQRGTHYCISSESSNLMIGGPMMRWGQHAATEKHNRTIGSVAQVAQSILLDLICLVLFCSSVMIRSP